MELNTLSQPDFTALATVIFEKRKASLPQEALKSGMFNVEDVPENTGETKKFTEVDTEEYADRKPQGDQAARARVQQGYSKIIEVNRFAKDIGITWEMRHYNKYPEVIKRLSSLANLTINRRELNLQHRIGFGASTTYTDKNGYLIDISLGDDLALFSTVHKLTGSSTTYRNRLANNPQLSKGALEAMESMTITNAYNNFGEQVTQNYDILWTTNDPNTCNTALEYLKSTSAPDGLNSGVINVVQNKYKHVKLSRVATDANGAPDSTKAKYWGIASSTGTTAHVGIWEEEHLKTPGELNAGEEFDTDNWNYGVREGHGICILTGSWLGMSSGDGTA